MSRKFNVKVAYRKGMHGEYLNQLSCVIESADAWSALRAVLSENGIFDTSIIRVSALDLAEERGRNTDIQT